MKSKNIKNLTLFKERGYVYSGGGVVRLVPNGRLPYCKWNVGLEGVTFTDTVSYGPMGKL
jgi:hypothetical protein